MQLSFVKLVLIKKAGITLNYTAFQGKTKVPSLHVTGKKVFGLALLRYNVHYNSLIPL